MELWIADPVVVFWPQNIIRIVWQVRVWPLECGPSRFFSGSWDLKVNFGLVLRVSYSWITKSIWLRVLLYKKIVLFSKANFGSFTLLFLTFEIRRLWKKSFLRVIFRKIIFLIQYKKLHVSHGQSVRDRKTYGIYICLHENIPGNLLFWFPRTFSPWIHYLFKINKYICTELETEF